VFRDGAGERILLKLHRICADVAALSIILGRNLRAIFHETKLPAARYRLGKATGTAFALKWILTIPPRFTLKYNRQN